MSTRWLSIIFLTVLFGLGISLIEDISAQEIEYGKDNAGREYYRYCYPNGRCTDWKLSNSYPYSDNCSRYCNGSTTWDKIYAYNNNCSCLNAKLGKGEYCNLERSTCEIQCVGTSYCRNLCEEKYNKCMSN